MTEDQNPLDPGLERIAQLLEAVAAHGAEHEVIRARNRVVDFMGAPPTPRRRPWKSATLAAIAILAPAVVAAVVAASILGVFRPTAFRVAPAGPTPSAEETPTPSELPSASPSATPPGAPVAPPRVRTVTVCDWAVVPSPNPPGFPELGRLAVIGPKDIWAVGGAGSSTGSKPFALHWDGVKWSLVATAPLAAGASAGFNDVAGSATNDVWAVGSITDADKHEHPLAEHWDGANWMVKPTVDPNLGVSSALAAVSAAGPGVVFAVGNTGGAALIEHWDGASWALQTSSSSSDGSLTDVAVNSAANAVAVGVAKGQSYLIERWDGSTWKQQGSPLYTGDPSYRGGLKGVTFVPGSDQAWAVGDGVVPGFAGQPLALRFDGTWTQPGAPLPSDTVLNDVTAVGASDVWAVGGRPNTAADALHWNGSSWTEVSFANGTGASDIGAVSSTELWAVGGSSNPSNTQWYTLIQHYTCHH
ncbi:MAG TPA: hypothetical protein VNV65_11900 [Candidatus Solibacter sp.]|jgi:hypothetical protein|nr:hypothetical protein [Candidatus Solibacter sp.]